MLKNSTGGSSIGCLLTIAIVGCFLYAGYKFAVVQWNIESFKEQMTEVTRFWAIEKQSDDIDSIKADVMRKAEKCGVSLEVEGITVKTEGGAVSIQASWVEQIEFPGGYVYERDITISRSIRKKGH
jgi:hypothetical protein